MITEKSLASKRRWDNEHMGTVSARLTKETKERFQEICAKNGKKPNEVLKRFINDYIASDGQPYDSGAIDE